MGLSYILYNDKKEVLDTSNLVTSISRLHNNIKVLKEAEFLPDFEVEKVGRLLSVEVAVHKYEDDETNEICPMIGFECECTYNNEGVHKGLVHELYFISLWCRNDSTGSKPLYGEGNNVFGKSTTFGDSCCNDIVDVKEEICSIEITQDAIKKYVNSKLKKHSA